MKNKLIRYLLVGAIASTCSLALQVQGNQITGQVNFTGVVSSDSGDLSLSTLLNSFNTVVVGVGSGSFAPTVGSGVGHGDLVFNPNSVSVATPINGLWSYTHAGKTYSFDLQTLAITPGGDSTHLGLEGTGIAHVTGFSDTAATWSLAATSQGLATFTFAESTTVSLVPDGTATSGLMAGGLCVLGLLRRRMVLAA